MPKIFYYHFPYAPYFVSFNNNIIPTPYAKSLLERGNGAFETTLYFPKEKVLLYREKHVKRLIASADYAGISLANLFSCKKSKLYKHITDLYQNTSDRAIKELEPALAQHSGSFPPFESKIIVSNDSAFIIVRPLTFSTKIFSEGVSLISITHEKPLPLIKSPGFYAPTEILIQHANDFFADTYIEECLLLDANGNFLECSKASFCVIDKGGTIINAKPGKVLASITAQAIKNIARKQKWQYLETDYNLYHAPKHNISEAFIASSLRGIVGVKQIIPIEFSLDKKLKLHEIKKDQISRIILTDAKNQQESNFPTVAKLQELYQKEIKSYVKNY